MTPRERLKIHDRDVWEAIDVITRHLGDRFEAVKVKAHVDRHHKKPSLHEKGNEYADAKADQSIREELTVEVRAAAKARIDKLRPSRWRLHHLEGPEITRGLKTAIKEGCSRAAGKADDRERLKAGRQVRYRLDSRLMTMATSKARKALAGPCVEALGEGGADAPEEWLHARAGWRGGGLLYRQAQLCKFLHGRLVTQHIKEERARGGNEQCGVCSDWVRADNDHMLFQCRGREIVQARRQWIGRVQQAWASAALPKRFKEEARARWELEETGEMVGYITPANRRIQPAAIPDAEGAGEGGDGGDGGKGAEEGREGGEGQGRERGEGVGGEEEHKGEEAAGGAGGEDDLQGAAGGGRGGGGGGGSGGAHLFVGGSPAGLTQAERLRCGEGGEVNVEVSDDLDLELSSGEEREESKPENREVGGVEEHKGEEAAGGAGGEDDPQGPAEGGRGGRFRGGGGGGGARLPVGGSPAGLTQAERLRCVEGGEVNVDVSDDLDLELSSEGEREESKPENGREPWEESEDDELFNSALNRAEEARELEVVRAQLRVGLRGGREGEEEAPADRGARRRQGGGHGHIRHPLEVRLEGDMGERLGRCSLRGGSRGGRGGQHEPHTPGTGRSDCSRPGGVAPTVGRAQPIDPQEERLDREAGELLEHVEISGEEGQRHGERAYQTRPYGRPSGGTGAPRRGRAGGGGEMVTDKEVADGD